MRVFFDFFFFFRGFFQQGSLVTAGAYCVSVTKIRGCVESPKKKKMKKQQIVNNVTFNVVLKVQCCCCFHASKGRGRLHNQKKAGTTVAIGGQVTTAKVRFFFFLFSVA